MAGWRQACICSIGSSRRAEQQRHEQQQHHHRPPYQHSKTHPASRMYSRVHRDPGVWSAIFPFSIIRLPNIDINTSLLTLSLLISAGYAFQIIFLTKRSVMLTNRYQYIIGHVGTVDFIVVTLLYLKGHHWCFVSRTSTFNRNRPSCSCVWLIMWVHPYSVVNNITHHI